MRVTTRMLNASSKRAGIMPHQGNLLSYAGQSAAKTNPLLKSVQAQKNSASKAKYEKQEKTADELSQQVKKFTDAKEKNVFDKYAETGDASGIYKQAQELVNSYNSLVSSLNNNPDSFDSFYRQSLTESVSSNKELLSQLGITAGKDGKLQIDSEKMKSAPIEKMQEAFGAKSNFLEKLEFMAGKVSDRAAANVQSVSGSYSRGGSMNYYSQNKFNFWG